MAVSSASRSSQLACLVIILGAFGLTNARQDCDSESQAQIPLGYTPYESIGVAYKVYTEQLTWEEARQACLGENAHLAIIDSMEKVGYVAGLKGFNVYVWTGISRSSSQGPWVSSGSHTVMPNFPWAPGKPAGSHNCLAVRGCNRGLTNESCTRRLGFVCQMPLCYGVIDIN